MSVEVQNRLLEALRKRGGRGTLGDLMSDTALDAEAVRGNILPALSSGRGHVAVDENGELLYTLERSRRPIQAHWLSAAWRVVASALKSAYFAGLLIFLISYFIFYVLLLIALAVAALALVLRGGDGCDCDCGGCDCDGCDCNGCDCGCDCAAACADCNVGCCGGIGERAQDPERSERRRQHRANRKKRRVDRKQRRRERRRSRLKSIRSGIGLTSEPEVLGLTLERGTVRAATSRLRTVHAFVFGPRPKPLDPQARERNILSYIREHAGRITASDTAALTGLPLEQADALTLDLTARFEGDIEVSEDGAIIYTFDTLITTADERSDFLDFVRSEGRVTVEQTARFLGVSADEARERLEALGRRFGGRFEHEAETTFVYEPHEQPTAPVPELRDYSYAWERLETSPPIIGVPDGSYGWLIGFNSLNLILSFIVAITTRNPDGSVTLLEQQWGPLTTPEADPWVIGWVPFFFSLGVFVIPLIRTVIRAIRDRLRLRRNAWRVFLLGLFHRLEEDAALYADDILVELFGHDPNDTRYTRVATRMLERAQRRFEGSIDPEGYTEARGHRYTFERVHLELTSAAHARLEVDLDALSVGTIVFDSAD